MRIGRLTGAILTAALLAAALLLAACDEEGEIIDEPGRFGSVTVSGDIFYPEYDFVGRGPFRIAVLTLEDFQAGNLGSPLGSQSVVGADVSPYTVEVPGNSGDVMVTAFNDVWADGQPQFDFEFRGSAPVHVADEDVSGVHFELRPLDVRVNGGAQPILLRPFDTLNAVIFPSYYVFRADPSGGIHTVAVTGPTADVAWELFDNYPDMLDPFSSFWIAQCDGSFTAADEVCATPSLIAGAEYFLRVYERSGTETTATLEITFP